MTIEINRRTFLQALIAAGASYALPTKATQAQVDELWAQAQANPWYFEVNELGTLVEADAASPQIWADIFDVTPRGFTTPKSVIGEIETAPLLVSHISNLMDDEIDSLENDLEDNPPSKNQELIALKKKIDTLKKAREESNDPWMDWIEMEGEAGVAKFRGHVDDWLSKSIDWMQSEWFPSGSMPQGAALNFFHRQPYDLLEALGVVIIEGEHPGSSYYAAELVGSIKEANANAERLGLPFRFKGAAA